MTSRRGSTKNTATAPSLESNSVKTFDLEKLVELVGEVREGSDGKEALQFLQQQNELLKSKLPDSSFGAVTADVFPVAYELIRQAGYLAHEFEQRGDTQNEERALHLRTGPVCWVYGHHRQMVGPAMVEWAECLLKLGENERAEAIFKSVVLDLVEVLDRPGAPDASEPTLKSLQRALDGYPEANDSWKQRTAQALAALQTD